MTMKNRRYEKLLCGALLAGSLMLEACAGGNGTPANTTESTALVESAADASAAESTEAAGILNADVQDKVNQLQDLISENYLFEEDEEQVKESIYAGMIAGLNDPYSVYYTAEEYQKLMEHTNGTYCGIGALVTQNRETGIITVAKVFSGSPAEEGGLLPDDIFISVGDVDLGSMDLDLAISQYVKGEEGTQVTITVYRPSTGEYLDLTMTRRVVETPTVEHQMLAGNLGYIEVSQFDSVTADQFKAAVDDLEAQNMAGLIIDLRGNPGGVLDAVVSMMDYILPDDIGNYSKTGGNTTLIYTEDKNGDGDCYAASDGHSVDVPMVVLVNGNSASASEVFSGAMKDYGWATLVGTTTFGKGIVQSIFPLEDGTAVKLTVSSYYTPAGNNIHGTGIDPDVEIELDSELATKSNISVEEDNQIQKAVEMLTTGDGLVSHISSSKTVVTVEDTDGEAACKGQKHMQLTAQKAMEAILPALEQQGALACYQVQSHTETEELRSRQVQYQLVSGGDSSANDLINLDYDMGSGQVHSVLIQMSDRANAELAFCELIRAMAAASGNTVSDADLADTTTQIDALADGASLSMQSDIFSAQAGVIGGLTIIAVSASE